MLAGRLRGRWPPGGGWGGLASWGAAPPAAAAEGSEPVGAALARGLAPPWRRFAILLLKVPFSGGENLHGQLRGTGPWRSVPGWTRVTEGGQASRVTLPSLRSPAFWQFQGLPRPREYLSA